MELTYLITEAEALKGCDSGMSQLRSAKNVDDLIQCFYDRIDYCLANNFPRKNFLLQYQNELRNAGVFIDEKANLESRPRLVFLGKSECVLSLDKYTVSRVYVKHQSKLHVRASGNSIIMIDALDDTEITVHINQNARVIVNLYANAECHVIAGNPRIIHKSRFTYEL